MAKVKICGLTRDLDIAMVNSLLPDYVGFVFAKSRRQVTEEIAMNLKKQLVPSIKAVGVFVNDEPEKVIRLCKTNTIDMIQLHGDEEEEYIRNLRATVPNQIIKAVRVRREADIQIAETLSCDYLLLDAYEEQQYGGSGVSFEWSIITELSKPFFLAGGINSENIARAIRLTKPYGIDVSSGVETNGFKDASKVKDIIRRARGIL